MENDEYILIKKESWEHLKSVIAALKKEVSYLKLNLPCKAIYSNQDIRDILGVNDKLIRKYRESGLLYFSNVGNKYWYTNENIKNFLKNGRQ